MSSTHPADREMLPDDPLQLSAVELPGDVNVMFRLLVEEYARMGYGTDAILRLASNPFYAGFHRFYLALGEEQFRSSVQDVIRRCGVVRVSEQRSGQCRT